MATSGGGYGVRDYDWDPYGEDEPNMFFQRINSSQIVYKPKKKTPKLVGKFIMGDMLGEGSYGKVKEGLDSENLRRVAIKIMKKKKLRKIPNGEQNVRKEITLLKRIKHKNIVELIDVCYNEEKQKMYIIMEHCCCTLQDMLENTESKTFPVWQAHFYFTQLCDGLEYMHSKGIVHRDIKPGNLLVTRDCTMKISDFGVAETLDHYQKEDICSSSCGSPAFQPPEIANGMDEFSGFKVDIWSAGVTLYNFLSGGYPFDGENIYHLFENIGKGVYTIPECIDPLAADLISGMLRVDSKHRFGLVEVKRHAWVQMEHEKMGEQVKIPTEYDGEGQGDTTLIPYLENLHYAGSNSGSSLLSQGGSAQNLTSTEASAQDPSAPDTSEGTTGSPNGRRLKKTAVRKFSLKDANRCRQS
eukprot:Nk52_evm8s230 gene=Nk52_evmTU8s230